MKEQSGVNPVIEGIIGDYINHYASSHLVSSIWQKPVIGFARANDPLFWELKQVISPTHSTPLELLPRAKSVVAYFIPFVKDIPKSNKANEVASEEWASTYVETNKLIISLNEHVAAKLAKFGFQSKVLPPTHNFDTESLISDWSHKHVAYIAGLGNFGYHHQLITEKGCCGRLGSLITEAPLEPSIRIDKEFCLNRYNKSCRICSQRCPVDAISDAEFIRKDCYQVLLENMERYQHLGLTDVCGKCVSIVPCSFLNPVAKQIRKSLKNEMKLIEAEHSDLPVILDLQKRAYQIEADRYNDPGLPPLMQSLSDIELEFAEQKILKAVYKHNIIGSVRAKIEKDTCTINKLFVEPEYLRYGIAKALMLKVESVMAEAKRFELFTGHESTPALNLYQSMGYQEFARKELATHTLVFLEKQVETPLN